MAIATMLAEEHSMNTEPPVFDIVDSQDVRGLWQGIQAKNTPKPTPSIVNMTTEQIRSESNTSNTKEPFAKRTPTWTQEEDVQLLLLRDRGFGWEEVSQRLPGHSPVVCELHWQNDLWKESMWTDEKKKKLAEIYER